MVAMETSTAFRRWRKRMRYTQPEVAKILGLSIAAVRNYEYGRRWSPPAEVLVPLVVRLACSSIEKGLGPID